MIESIVIMYIYTYTYIAYMYIIMYLKITYNNGCNAPVTRPYICQRTPTYGDTSDKLGARFI